VKPDWGHVYHPCIEDIADDAPKPLGKCVLTTSFVDANLMFNLTTGRSATGIIHMLNKTPIGWFCKKQNVVETASYGSEFTAMKICVEQVIALCHDLRYLGVPIVGPSCVFGDNKSVTDSGMKPSYRLKKRHNILAYHHVREAIASDIVRCYHIDGKYNPADIMTKFHSSREWYELMKPMIFQAWRDENGIETETVTHSEGSDNMESNLVTG